MESRFEDQIKKAVQVLKKGGVVVFPTDTVWGMGASLSRLDAIKRMYTLKGRNEGKPTAVLLSGLVQAQRLGEFNDLALGLAKKYWPGKLTIVVKAKERVPEFVQGGTGTVGLRVPDLELVRRLCDELGGGMVAGSANFSGMKEPGEREEIDPRIKSAVDLVMEGVGEIGGNQERKASTVVEATSEKLKVLRDGPVKIVNGNSQSEEERINMKGDK